MVMALDIRKVRYDTADAVRMLKDVVDFSVIPSNIRSQIWNSLDVMNIVVNSSNTMGNIANSSLAMNEIIALPSTMDIIVASTTAMNVIANSSIAMDIIANSSDAMDIIVASTTAMNAIAASSIAMGVVGSSVTAMNTIMNSTNADIWWGSSYAVGKGLNTYASLNNSTLEGLNTVSDIMASSNAMDAIAASTTAMNAIIASSIAMNTMVSSSTAMGVVVASSTAMNTIWSVDSARQALWSSATARLALYNNPTRLKALTVDSTPNLVDETPLNTDKSAGYLHYTGKTFSKSTGWTAVNINDGGKYLVWIHFYSGDTYDWYAGKIASYNQSTNLQVTNGGSNLTRGNFSTTSNGLWVWFHDINTGDLENASYARVWYIKV